MKTKLLMFIGILGAIAMLSGCASPMNTGCCGYSTVSSYCGSCVTSSYCGSCGVSSCGSGCAVY